MRKASRPLLSPPRRVMLHPAPGTPAATGLGRRLALPVLQISSTSPATSCGPPAPEEILDTRPSCGSRRCVKNVDCAIRTVQRRPPTTPSASSATHPGPGGEEFHHQLHHRGTQRGDGNTEPASLSRSSVMPHAPRERPTRQTPPGSGLGPASPRTRGAARGNGELAGGARPNWRTPIGASSSGSPSRRRRPSARRLHLRHGTRADEQVGTCHRCWRRGRCPGWRRPAASDAGPAGRRSINRALKAKQYVRRRPMPADAQGEVNSPRIGKSVERLGGMHFWKNGPTHTGRRHRAETLSALRPP